MHLHWSYGFFVLASLVITTNGYFRAKRHHLDDIEFETGEDEYVTDTRSSNDQMGATPCNGTYIKSSGTMCSLKEVIIGRCNAIQFVERALYMGNRVQTKNCTQLYEKFEASVRYKDFCDMNMTSYETYFDWVLDGIDLISPAMFWSGTSKIAHAYSNRGLDFITLEDTLAAGVVDGISWCGTSQGDGFDYVTCPRGCEFNKYADLAFWGLASQMFAQRVGGEIYVVLNGSRTDNRPAFRNDSIFALYELPNFRTNGSNRVTKINVLLLHSPDLPVMERCGEKSLILLKEAIETAGFSYSCVDDPDELLFLMCNDDRTAKDCQSGRAKLREVWDKKVTGKSNAVPHSTSVVLLISSLIQTFMRK